MVYYEDEKIENTIASSNSSRSNFRHNCTSGWQFQRAESLHYGHSNQEFFLNNLQYTATILVVMLRYFFKHDECNFNPLSIVAQCCDVLVVVVNHAFIIIPAG